MANPQRLETVRRIQTAMSAGYSTMSLWVLIHPSSVLSLSLTPTYAIINRTTLLLFRCFGAQALTTGLLLGTAPMDERSFTYFGLAMIPYLMFNAWFLAGPGKGVFTGWLWMDCIGNVVFAAGSAWCAKLLKEDREENEAGKAK